MIDADYTTLLRQAYMTAHDYMLHAVADIDERLGKGYAKEHPELIAAYMWTAAADFGCASIAKEFGEAISNLAETLGRGVADRAELLNDTIETGDTVGKAIDGISEDLRRRG